ncbi:MAG: GyrI-like domain-containing protein [Thermoplasmatota archaeon]
MTKIKIKDRKESNVLCVQHDGDYKKIPHNEYFKMLKSWAKEHKARPYSKPIGIFYDYTKRDEKDDLKADIGIPIKKKKPTSGSMHIKYLPKMKVAQAKYKGTQEDIDEVYKEIYDYIKKEGYKPSGSPMEIYKGKTKEVDGKKVMKGVIQIPINKNR